MTLPAPLKVAIIGGGPGGLAAAIALGQLNVPGQSLAVDWTLYEKKPRISETGGGITLQQNTWRMLERLGVAEHIDARDFYRAADGRAGEHRNAVNGQLLQVNQVPDDTPPHQVSCRMVRAKLQRALLSAVGESTRIRVGKKLVRISPTKGEDEVRGERGQNPEKLRLEFEDGEVTEVDLVVGADGIRSVARQVVAPGHTLRYNGQSAYRTILRKSDVAAVNGIPSCPVFWQYVGGKYVFTCPLGNDDFEVTARICPDGGSDAAAAVSWGQPFDLHRLLPLYADFAPPLRHILRLAAEAGTTQEFAMFNGPRLESCVSVHGSQAGLALLGDASHPLSGAFGAGAGFAFEDAYTLARGLAWARASGRSLAAALTVYDRARSLHYHNLYNTLDRMAASASDVARENLPLQDQIRERLLRAGETSADWAYRYEADVVVEHVIREEEEKEMAATQTATEHPVSGKTIAEERHLPTGTDLNQPEKVHTTPELITSTA